MLEPPARLMVGRAAAPGGLSFTTGALWLQAGPRCSGVHPGLADVLSPEPLAELNTVLTPPTWLCLGVADGVRSGHRRQAAPQPLAHVAPLCLSTTPQAAHQVNSEMVRQVVFASLLASCQGSTVPLQGLPKLVHNAPICQSAACCCGVSRLLHISRQLLASAVMELLWSLLLQSARGFLNQVTASFTRRRTVEPSGSPGKPASPSGITALLGGESPVGGTSAGEAGEFGLLGAIWSPTWQQSRPGTLGTGEGGPAAGAAAECCAQPRPAPVTTLVGGGGVACLRHYSWQCRG